MQFQIKKIEMNSPIIVVHQGVAEYLKLCLLKARQYNPSTPIVLIGDEENICLVDLIPDLTHVIPDHTNDDILTLKNNYKHRNTQTEAWKTFELMCLMRWFFVRDFMKQNKIERCLHIDSDVLLFCDVWQAGEPFQKYGMTLAPWGDTYNLMGHTCYINDLQLLDRYCNLIQDYYSDPEKSRFLDETMYAKFLRREKGARFEVSDMTFLKILHDENPQLFGNVSDIVNGSTFDNRLTSCIGGWATNTRLIKDEMKKIIFENKIPYCWNKALQKKVRFHSVHFHGPMKYMIKYFFQEKVNYYGDILIERAKIKLRKLFQ